MENSVEKNNIEKKEITIYSTKLTRRILIYLADLILTLLVAAFFYEIVVAPLYKFSSDYSKRAQEVSTNYRARIGILYSNNLLFYDNEAEKFDMQKNLEVTSDDFLRYYTYDQSAETSEIFYHYFCEIRNLDVENLNKLYVKYGEDYFDKSSFTSVGTYTLKDEVVNLFRPNFVAGDELSEDGLREYEHFESVFFLNMYSEMLNDVEKNDLSNPNLEITYNGYTKLINDFDSYYWNFVTIASVVSFLIACAILYFLIPLINKKGRTLSEMILKVEHVKIKNIEYLKKGKICILGFFNTINSLPILFLVSMASSGFNGILSLTYLLVFSGISLVFVIVELFMIIFTKFSQSSKEILTKSILVDTKLIDEYYKLKSYEF